MKLLLLRHQKRNNTVDFETSLSNEGIILAAVETSKELEKFAITQIYVSPFYRVLQTIEPYLLNHPNRKINVEYSLYEVIGQKMFNEDNYKSEIKEEWVSRFNVDESYQSFTKINDLVYPETHEIINERVCKFIDWLHHKYDNTDEVILIVSHQFIIHKIMEYCGQRIPEGGVAMGDIISM